MPNMEKSMLDEAPPPPDGLSRVSDGPKPEATPLAICRIVCGFVVPMPKLPVVSSVILVDEPDPMKTIFDPDSSRGSSLAVARFDDCRIVLVPSHSKVPPIPDVGQPPPITCNAPLTLHIAVGLAV